MFSKYFSSLIGWENSIEINKDFLTIIEKITKASNTFKWLDTQKITEWIINKKIRIFSLLPWEILIDELNDDCSLMYLLLRWKIGVYKGSKKLVIINTLTIIWEIGFTNPDLWRTATVKSLEESYFMEISKTFIDSLELSDQILMWKNLNMELSEKLSNMNSKIAEWAEKMNLWDTINKTVKDGVTSIL